MRKASQGKSAELIPLAQRLQKLIREGTQVLAMLEEPIAAHLAPVSPVANTTPMFNDGHWS